MLETGMIQPRSVQLAEAFVARAYDSLEPTEVWIDALTKILDQYAAEQIAGLQTVTDQLVAEVNVANAQVARLEEQLAGQTAMLSSFRDLAVEANTLIELWRRDKRQLWARCLARTDVAWTLAEIEDTLASPAIQGTLRRRQ